MLLANFQFQFSLSSTRSLYMHDAYLCVRLVKRGAYTLRAVSMRRHCCRRDGDTFVYTVNRTGHLSKNRV